MSSYFFLISFVVLVHSVLSLCPVFLRVFWGLALILKVLISFELILYMVQEMSVSLSLVCVWVFPAPLEETVLSQLNCLGALVGNQSDLDKRDCFSTRFRSLIYVSVPVAAPYPLSVLLFFLTTIVFSVLESGRASLCPYFPVLLRQLEDFSL